MSVPRARLAAFAVLAAFAGLFATGCGDPITVLGDNPNTMRIVAGVPDQSGKTAEAKATESLFSQPAGIVVDADGLMYIADSQNRRIVRVASNGDLTVVKDDGFCTGTCLVRPTGLALDSSGRLLVSDPGGNRIWTIDPRHWPGYCPRRHRRTGDFAGRSAGERIADRRAARYRRRSGRDCVFC